MKVLVVFFLFILALFKVSAQPIGEENFSKVAFYILDKGNDTVIFNKMVDDKFVSYDSKYELEVYTCRPFNNEKKQKVKDVFSYKDGTFSIVYISSVDSFPKDGKHEEEFDLVVLLIRGKEKMFIYFKTYHRSMYELPIKFKKGKYEVTDPDDPVLKKIRGH